MASLSSPGGVNFEPLVNVTLDVSLSDSDRLRFVHEICWVVSRGVGSLVGFGGCAGATLKKGKLVRKLVLFFHVLGF